jgi:predicted TIM-barrel fold metal-dependent hydrolase
MTVLKNETIKLNSDASEEFRTPIPTQIVASEEYAPVPPTDNQRRVHSRLMELGTTLAKKHGMSRRKFFQTAAGMAASYLVMNEVYGQVFDASTNEVTAPELANERARSLSSQVIFDAHTHFVRDDPSPELADPGRAGGFLWQRMTVAKFPWNKDIAGKPQTIKDLQFQNFMKEIFFDSDTRIALLTNAPSDDPADWLLPQEEVFRTREKVNSEAGTKRVLAHFTISPGKPGWLDAVDQAIEVYKPDAWKGYTIGDVVLAHGGKHAYALDDEKLMYPFYEKALKAGIRTICVHKGLFPLAAEARLPHLRRSASVDDVGKAARDWPQLNFAIYHSGYRHLGGAPSDSMNEWERTGRLSWLSDLAEIPERYGVDNVYGDLGAIFAWTVIAQPRLAAAMMGTLVKGLGADHIIWGTDSIWTGSPQWQIEALRRLEIPEDMQRQHRFPPLGPADGLVKNAIFSTNGLKLFNYAPDIIAIDADRLAQQKRNYEKTGIIRSNARYGYIAAE